jgi:hypothetical protein
MNMIALGDPVRRAVDDAVAGIHSGNDFDARAHVAADLDILEHDAIVATDRRDLHAVLAE